MKRVCLSRRWCPATTSNFCRSRSPEARPVTVTALGRCPPTSRPVGSRLCQHGVCSPLLGRTPAKASVVWTIVESSSRMLTLSSSTKRRLSSTTRCLCPPPCQPGPEQGEAPQSFPPNARRMASSRCRPPGVSALSFKVRLLQGDSTPWARSSPCALTWTCSPPRGEPNHLCASGRSSPARAEAWSSPHPVVDWRNRLAAPAVLQERIKLEGDRPPFLTAICVYALHSTKQLRDAAEDASPSSTCLRQALERAVQKAEARAPPRGSMACDTLEEEDSVGTEMEILQGPCGPVCSTHSS
jgi:hypothetical protein